MNVVMTTFDRLIRYTDTTKFYLREKKIYVL